MRIFVLGAGATGSLLAQLLVRQGHDVWCGDRDLERARKFLGRKSTIPVTEVNARNLLGIVRAARGCQLIVNASASVFNQIVMRAALRLRAHYLDLSSHLTRNRFMKSSRFRFACTRAQKAGTLFRNGRRKSPSTRPSLTRAFTAMENSGWRSASRSWKNLDFPSPSETPSSCWPRKKRSP